MNVAPHPTRIEVQTTDRDRAAAAVNQVVAHQARLALAALTEVNFIFRAITYGDLATIRVRMAGVHYSASVPSMPALFAGVFTGGLATVRAGGVELDLGPRDGLLYPTRMSIGGEFHNSTQRFLSLPATLAAETAEATTGLPAADLRFHLGIPVSEAKREFWLQTVNFISRQLAAPGVDHPPLVVEHFLRQAAAAVLTVFPNTTMTSGYVPGAGRVDPVALRRAVAFMEAHADQPLAVSRIAGAAGVGPRALQQAFRQHLGSTPLAYLRRIRLERVHHDLLGADPADGGTVEGIARRWGFADPGRFAGYYRTAYGVSPKTTLQA
jgi:AraC-like DNA-binding protein